MVPAIGPLTRWLVSMSNQGRPERSSHAVASMEGCKHATVAIAPAVRQCRSITLTLSGPAVGKPVLGFKRWLMTRPSLFSIRS